MARSMFRYVVGRGPGLSVGFVTRNDETQSYHTRSRNHFHSPCIKTDRRKSSFTYQGVIWNLFLQDIINFNEFKDNLVKHDVVFLLSGTLRDTFFFWKLFIIWPPNVLFCILLCIVHWYDIYWYSKYEVRCPFDLHGLTLIPAWISNHMASKVWGEITIHFQTQRLRRWSLWMYNGCNYLSMLV